MRRPTNDLETKICSETFFNQSKTARIDTWLTQLNDIVSLQKAIEEQLWKNVKAIRYHLAGCIFFFLTNPL